MFECCERLYYSNECIKTPIRGTSPGTLPSSTIQLPSSSTTLDHSLHKKNKNKHCQNKSNSQNNNSNNNKTNNNNNNNDDDVIKQEPTSTVTCVAQRKKRDRFNGVPEEDVLKRTVPDLLSQHLDIIIVSGGGGRG